MQPTLTVAPDELLYTADWALWVDVLMKDLSKAGEWTAKWKVLFNVSVK